MTVRRRRYHMKARYSWGDVHAGRRAIDQHHDTEAEALAAARASDCPLIDVISPDGRIIADRETLRHPQMAEPWSPRDTLADR